MSRKYWIAKYSQNVVCMNRLLKDKNAPKKAKQIIHQTILRPILILGSECWTCDKKARTADCNGQLTGVMEKMVEFLPGVW